MKKAISVILIIIAFILLIPFPQRYKDGGSVCYKAVLYSVTKYHKLPDMESDAKYIGGTCVEIFGIPVYDNEYPVY